MAAQWSDPFVLPRGRQRVYGVTVDQVAGVVAGFHGVREVRHHRGRAFSYRIDRFDGSGYRCLICVVPDEGGGTLVTVSASGRGDHWTPVKHAAAAVHIPAVQRAILVEIARQLPDPRDRGLDH